MTTNLTIELDNNLLESLNQYAKSRGRIVSEILEGQLRKWVQIQSKRKTTPVSTKLRGVVKLPKDIQELIGIASGVDDVEDERLNYLLNK